MRKILKAVEPESVTQWKAQANDDWQPSYATLQNPQKRDLHLSLLNEQGHLCCYCGRRIGPEDSHVEHFRPQELFQTLELDYENLHASCIRQKIQGRHYTAAITKEIGSKSTCTFHRLRKHAKSASATYLRVKFNRLTKEILQL